MSLSRFQRGVSIFADKFFSEMRHNQIVDETLDFYYHLWVAGRGFGKTHSLNGAVFLRAALEPNSQSAIVAPTNSDTKDVTMNNPRSGMKSIIPIDCLLGYSWETGYNISDGIIKLGNGSLIYLFSAEKPDRLRGKNLICAGLEEYCFFKNPEDILSMLEFAVRVGSNPRIYVATTPKPIAALKKLIKDKKSIVVRGSTYDNKANLSPQFLKTIEEKYEGTRLGRQELHAEILEDIEGSLWTWAMIEKSRLPKDKMPTMQRIVVAIDPSGGGKDKQGIVVAGKGIDGLYYVLEDCSCSLSPEGWARVAIDAYNRHGADLIVAEQNYGGDMVKSVVKAVDDNVPYKMVHASRAKQIRAEPIAALYEQGKVKHIGSFETLELQMTEMTTQGFQGSGSPDSLDALVWALTELSNGVSIDIDTLIGSF
jgi:phage terminase large subunit-like protein